MIGYICPNCEEIRSGLPAIYEEDGNIIFYCAHCMDEWTNTTDSLRFGIIEVDWKNNGSNKN